MDQAPLPEKEPANLRFLRILVTVLTATMILGVLAIIVLLVMRLQQPAPLALPDQLTLPDGTTATAFTQTDDWIAIITDDNRIVIYERDGTLRQTIQID
ncbi:DUF6476 family protein [Cognatishimia sp. MH4019]|uniref:DUF6476 family protein n=1 Tax=Cognatishimia sp. MH4019 TaxID=2854030 RepID=UPI001CD1977B|nr:DUF6476 family protein [Cognatishimia sp. MH4019]